MRTPYYYFLGLVALDDVLAGDIRPSYIVCQSSGKKESRSGIRVVKANGSFAGMKKIMITNMNAHPDLIDFMSNYRTRDHMHSMKARQHAKTMKYTPEGALFWFPCTKTGLESRYNYKPVFIKFVPDKKGRLTDDGFTRLKEAREHTLTWKELYLREPYGEYNETGEWRSQWQNSRKQRTASKS